MKSFICIVLVCVVLPIFASTVAGCGYPIRFTITDEESRPIEGAEVAVTYQTGFVPGDGFGRDVNKTFKRKTNADGIVKARISPFGGKTFAYGVDDPSGQYHNSLSLDHVRLNEDGSVTECSMVLRKKRNPIPLLFPTNWWEMRLPKRDGYAIGHKEPLGYDMMVADWVKPYGKGEITDWVFRFTCKLDGKYETRFKNARWRYSRLELTFSNPDDGIVEAPLKWPFSELSVDYEAPAAGYQSVFARINHFPPQEEDFKADSMRQYFFRVRTRRDENGAIVYALYGKLVGDFKVSSLRYSDVFTFEYYLNPTPLDRNLEYNGTNLKSDTTLRTHVNADYIRRFPSVLLRQSELMRTLPPLTVPDEIKEKSLTP